jgi:hypothetical protein
MRSLSLRRLTSVVLTLVILAVPSLVTALTAAPNCGSACTIHFIVPWH